VSESRSVSVLLYLCVVMAVLAIVLGLLIVGMAVGIVPVRR
jgi:hypothetical protein